MSISNYAELALLNAVFNATSFSVATPYVKLHTGDPGEDCTGNAAGNTTRQAASFGNAASGAVVSDADTTWTNVSTSETYSHLSIWDAASAGNALWNGSLATSKAVVAGGAFTISSGSLTVSLD